MRRELTELKKSMGDMHRTMQDMVRGSAAIQGRKRGNSCLLSTLPGQRASTSGIEGRARDVIGRQTTTSGEKEDGGSGLLPHEIFADKIADPEDTGVHEALLGNGIASSDLPHVELVSPKLRADIIAGKNVNLASLLIVETEPEWSQSVIVVDQQAVPLKPIKDQRLARALTLPEFIKAFTIYRNVMCETYPHRREELDHYLRHIVQMATDFGGLMFYEYHRAFSARAAVLLLNHGIKVDWSRRDNDMYCKIFAGRRAIACNLCGSLLHGTGLCPLSTGQSGTGQTGRSTTSTSKNSSEKRAFSDNGRKDVKGTDRVFLGGKEICNNFNGARGCFASSCSYVHACSECKTSGHAASQCRPLYQGNSNASPKVQKIAHSATSSTPAGTTTVVQKRNNHAN